MVQTHPVADFVSQRPAQVKVFCGSSWQSLVLDNDSVISGQTCIVCRECRIAEKTLSLGILEPDSINIQRFCATISERVLHSGLINTVRGYSCEPVLVDSAGCINKLVAQSRRVEIAVQYFHLVGNLSFGDPTTLARLVRSDDMEVDFDDRIAYGLCACLLDEFLELELVGCLARSADVRPAVPATVGMGGSAQWLLSVGCSCNQGESADESQNN